MSDESLSEFGFLTRTLRWLAIIGLFFAGLQLLERAVDLVRNGLHLWLWIGFSTKFGRWLERSVLAALIAAPLLLIFGCIGLFRWKPWSRSALIVWAVLNIGIGLAYRAMFLVYITKVSRNYSMAFSVWWSLSSWLRDSIVPVAVLFILSQREVSNLWARPRGGGFEVLPLGAPL